MIYPNIRSEMDRNNITVRKLAEYLDLSVNSVSFRLNGRREFTLSEVEKLADVFGCSLDYLVGHEVRASVHNGVDKE